MENTLNSSYFFTNKFYEAIKLAVELHSNQVRKGTQIPYISHLMIVAGMVIEDGGDEDEAIAALLHDAIEDQGGARTREEIQKRFGDKIAGIIDECSDTDVEPKPPWRERKEAYLKHLVNASPEAMRVSLADKLHNARSIVADVNNEGEEVWKRFNAAPDELLWYYKSLVEIYHGRIFSRMVFEYEAIVRELEKLVTLKLNGVANMNKAEVENKGIDEQLFNVLVKRFQEVPFLNTMAITLLYLGQGIAGIKMTTSHEYTTVKGRLHGGIIAALADSVMGWSALSLGRISVTVDMTLNYFAPVFEATELTAKGYVIHAGRNTVIAEAELFANNEKLVAKSRGTFFVQTQAEIED